jgi:hypothetical protein
MSICILIVKGISDIKLNMENGDNRHLWQSDSDPVINLQPKAL